jgi:hypothetical protein
VEAGEVVADEHRPGGNPEPLGCPGSAAGVQAREHHLLCDKHDLVFQIDPLRSAVFNVVDLFEDEGGL